MNRERPSPWPDARAWRSTPLVLMATLGSGLIACVGPTGGATGHHRAPRAVPAPVALDSEAPPPWREALAELNSIPQLWNAQNRHQDHLGRALAQMETHRSSPGMGRALTGPGTPGPTPRHPTPIPRPPPPDRDHRRAEPRRDSLCHRICQHVAAICYASGRICGIASRLGEPGALNACERARERCQDAKLAARRRCAPCQ